MSAYLSKLTKGKGLLVILVILVAGLFSAVILLFGDRPASIILEDDNFRFTVLSPEPNSEAGAYLVHFEIVRN